MPLVLFCCHDLTEKDIGTLIIRSLQVKGVLTGFTKSYFVIFNGVTKMSRGKI